MPSGIVRVLVLILIAFSCAAALLGAEDDTPTPPAPEPQPKPFEAPPEPESTQPKPFEAPEETPTTPKPVVPKSATENAPAESQFQPPQAPRTVNAPGSIYQLDYLTPGGLRAPADLVAPAPKPIPSGNDHGLNFERVRIFPGFAYDLTFTDNSLRTETSKKEDALMEYGPNISMVAHPTEKVAITIAYAFLEHDYTRNTARDYLSHSAVGTFAFKDVFIDHLNITLGDTYLQTGNTNVLETNILQAQRFEDNKAFGAVNYTNDRVAIAARYELDTLDYISHVAPGSNVRSEAATIDGSYRLSDPFELFATYSLLRTFSDGNTFNLADEDRHTAETGFVARFGKFSFTGAGGYTWSQVLYGGPQDDGAVATASINYHPDEHWEVGGYGGVGISQNARQGRLIGQSRDLTLEGQGGEPVSFGTFVNYRPWQHIRLSVNLDKTNSQGILTGSTNDLLFGGSAQLTLNERSSVNATVFRDYSRGTGTKSLTNSYSANYNYLLTHRFTLVFSFQRTEQLDLKLHNAIDTDEARFGFRFDW
jgi:hypothetical protein